MNYAKSIISNIFRDFGKMVDNMGPAGWITLAVIALIAGFLLLRGNGLRSS